jgi:DNA-binding CsgD family transcriptional regulator/tetratricopeptide (TPR) repeat protein
MMLAAVTWTRGQYAVARAQLEEAQALLQEGDDTWNRGLCLTQLTRIAIAQGDYARAQALLEESLRLYRALGDDARIGWVLFLQAQTLFLSGGNQAQAQFLAEQSLALMREISHNSLTFYALRLLGQLRLHQQELTQARELFEAVLVTAQEDDNQFETATTQVDLARVFTLQGEAARARALYERSLPVLRKLNSWEFLIPGLEGLASLEAGQGDPAWAARLWGAAEALREAIGAPMAPVDRPNYERAVTAVRAQLGENAFATAWAKGRAMTPEQALAARGPATVSSPPPPARLSPTYPDDLTVREVEVLRLLAQGLTDAQIADNLVISPRTVNNHLTSIYRKIQVSSRSAATHYAFEHHLV